MEVENSDSTENKKGDTQSVSRKAGGELKSKET